MKYRVFVTKEVPEVALKLLRKQGYKILVGGNPNKKAQGVEAVLCLLTDRVDGKLMDAIGPQLKIISNCAVGLDNIDVAAAKKRGIVVTNTPDVLTQAVAEYTIALLFSQARRVAEADRFMRSGKFKGWDPRLFLGSDISQKTLGIVGLGRIGVEVARRMHDGFGLKILYYDVKRNQKLEQKFGLEYRSLHALLRESDFVSLHVPLLSSTRHLIGTREFKVMKKTAYLINTARGAVVDEKALVLALKTNRIKGAALDVFENEPKLSKGLVKLQNVLLTPHIASATEETRDAMAELAAKNIIMVLEHI
ncbi:D-glycerate dehydrogenase [Patescibacteria group bacterium]|nr:D-glycerate dehydrogenase [Patescibacteria group bacterium]